VSKRLPPPPAEQKKAYTVGEFCDLYRMSRTELYHQWAIGAGPRRKKLGPKKVIILIEDAEAWARSDDAKTSAA
jgi:predicted DNA-binding transcriptional regulator AlpA